MNASLLQLGFTTWFQERLPSPAVEHLRLARVVSVDRDQYLVRNEFGETRAEILGKIRWEARSNLDFPTVGDWVHAQYFDGDTFAVIHEILPRKSVLKRKVAGKGVDYQLIGSNIDTACIMQSLDADFNLRRLERYLVMVHEAKIDPVVLLSKCDLVSEELIQQRLKDLRNNQPVQEVVAFSSHTGMGLNQIEGLIQPHRTYCLLGSSGVGKTTLLNRLLGQDLYATQPVRERDGKGRHTTARRQLLLLKNGGLLIDTPGMRELGNIAVDTGITETFSEILTLATRCRFRDCSHTNEPDCGVLEALQSGDLDADRYQSYMKLRRESEYYARSYVERRRRDKEFGKLFKDVMRHNRKR